MFPPKKRHAPSHYSLQLNSPPQSITVRDQQGINRQFPVSDQQMQQVMSILGSSQQSATPVQPHMQPGFGSLTSVGSFQSGISVHSSQASGINVPTSGYV